MVEERTKKQKNKTDGSEVLLISSSEMVGQIPVIRQKQISGSPKERLLIIHGGCQDVNLRFLLKETLGYETSKSLGVESLVFDFRTNLESDGFKKFGYHDRVEDATAVFEWASSLLPKMPISIMGISMGGPMAIHIAAQNSGLVKNLFLISPAAYDREACKPDVVFQPFFTDIIRKHESWRNSDSFEEISRIRANILIVRYHGDNVVPSEICRNYYQNANSFNGKFKTVYSLQNGGHDRMYRDSEKISKICKLIKLWKLI